MGLDTRAYRKVPDEERAAQVGVPQESYLFGVIPQVRTPETLAETFKFDQKGLDELPWPSGLVGGGLGTSGHGDGPSFRGKVYDDYVEQHTGVSLYEACHDNLHGEELERVAATLERVAETAETLALAQWFRVCADNGLYVGGDY